MHMLNQTSLYRVRRSDTIKLLEQHFFTLENISTSHWVQLSFLSCFQ